MFSQNTSNVCRIRRIVILTARDPHTFQGAKPGEVSTVLILPINIALEASELLTTNLADKCNKFRPPPAWVGGKRVFQTLFVLTFRSQPLLSIRSVVLTMVRGPFFLILLILLIILTYFLYFACFALRVPTITSRWIPIKIL